MQKKKNYRTLRLILGDQLNYFHSWFEKVDDEVLYVFMEIKPESEYVTHHIQKIMGIFKAMRSFAEFLKNKGHKIKYFKINDSDNQHSFQENIQYLIQEYSISEFEFQEPDEYRLDEILHNISNSLSIPFSMCLSEHFLTSRNELKDFFSGKKTYLMESFYRYMRKKWDILMENGQPLTGKWNYDQSNRKKLPKNHIVKSPLLFKNDLQDIYEEIQEAKLRYIGHVEAEKFIWPINRTQSLQILKFFFEEMLSDFGDYQDAMSNENWSIYHSRISFALNTKMLSPKEVIQQAEEFLNKDGIDISAVEGFIRQILGWREYMRGLYWAKMPEYENLNFFENQAKLPDWYWNGETKMNCLSKAIRQSLDYAYAHHIQRLMVTGNFALLAGVDPDEVDLWYLGIYIDAFQWVEITNTRGMSQYADGGIVATKPYVSSASYINKMGDHCSSCYYNPKLKTGEKSCPFNSLYWNFIDKNMGKLQGNRRMGMILNLWNKMDPEKKSSLLKQAEIYLQSIDSL